VEAPAAFTAGFVTTSVTLALGPGLGLRLLDIKPIRVGSHLPA